jgi:PAS domain S-box-containing protein
LAIGLAAVAIALQLALFAVLGPKLPLTLFFIPAVIVSAGVGGFNPGILTTALGCAFTAGYLGLDYPVELILLAVTGIAFSAVSEAWRMESSRSVEYEERLKATCSNVDDAVITTDGKGRITQMNPVAEALTLWMETEAKGRPAKDIFVVGADNPVDRAIRKGRASGEVNHSVLVSRSGREIPIDDTESLIKDAGGRVTGVVIVFRDARPRFSPDVVSPGLIERERKAREAAELAERAAHTAAGISERQLRLALETGRIGVWHWNVGSETVQWSQRLEAIYGYTPGSFPGTLAAVHNAIHIDDRDRALRAFQHAAESGKEYHIEYRIVRPDGTVRWIESRGEAFFDSLRGSRRLVGLCSDITESRQVASGAASR